MLFEKKLKVKRKRHELVFDFFAYGYIALIFVILFSFALTSIASMTGDKIKGIYVLNLLAQIATAGAFIFAIYQYRQNGEKERQNIIASEVKLLLQRMIAASDAVCVNEKYTIDDINGFIILISNLGIDFNALYEALTDDTHKAMVRMRWQDMHYNHLIKAVSYFTIDQLFENLNLEKDFKGCSFYDGRFSDEVKSKPDCMQEYTFTKKVLGEMSIGQDIVNKFTDLFLFNACFFDHENTNDLMYGLLSHIDIRVSAPLLAAVRDKKNS